MTAQPTPNPIDGFSAYLFWDVDRSALEVERSKAYIIERVFSHGMRTDWELIKAIYGKPAIKEVVLKARHLDVRSLHFCSAIFKVPKSRFRCYKLARLNPGHWDY